eukprot:COSAG01_NODE_3186_length_6441_cov_145.702460_9_plen_120_part_00
MSRRFLSASECAQLEELASREDDGSGFREWTPYDARHGVAEYKFLLPLEVQQHPLLRAIEARAAAWIGLPAADRTGLWLKRHLATREPPLPPLAASPPLPPQTDAVPPNVHVDNHEMPQ